MQNFNNNYGGPYQNPSYYNPYSQPKTNQYAFVNGIEGAKSLNIEGFNVTIPHKIEVMQYLNELDEVASLIGAVNTIDLKNLKGYNTDGIGAVCSQKLRKSLRRQNCQWRPVCLQQGEKG